MKWIFSTISRVPKGQHKAVKETKPGYSLYTTDSEDQVCDLKKKNFDNSLDDSFCV